MKRCRLSVLEAGSCRHPEAVVRRGASFAPTDFPALVGVIVHPEAGVILFDTGYDPAFLAATQPFPERLYRWATPVQLADGRSAELQLAGMGITPGDVRAIVISHFHGDHVAGLGRFPHAELHCARAGLEDLRRGGRLARVRRGLLSALVPDDAAGRARFFEDCARVSLPPGWGELGEGADLLGDGSLLAVELPGHCPGHWGLLLRTEADHSVFLVGDAAWSLGAIREDSPPPAITTALLGDTRTYRRTLSRLYRLGRDRPDVALIPSHCPRAARDAGLLA